MEENIENNDINDNNADNKPLENGMQTKQKVVRTVRGKVVSNKMEQTIVVLITRRVKHPLYRKYVIKSTKVHAHDADNSCQIGDEVTIVESRPLSKTKHWLLQSIDKKSESVLVSEV